jgi:hypothetical protein
MTAQQGSIAIAEVGPLELIAVDPYRSNPPQAARVQLRISPAKRAAALETHSPGQAIPIDQYHCRVLVAQVAVGPVDGPALVAWLREEAAQQLLVRICDGHEIEWDGSNMVGTLTADATEALTALEKELEDAPALEGEAAGLWDADDWIDAGGVIYEFDIDADTADARLSEIASAIEEQAAEENVVVLGVLNRLHTIRNDLKP